MFRSATYSDWILTGALRTGYWLQLVNEKSDSFLYHVELFLWYHLWLGRSSQTEKGFQMILLMRSLESILKANLGLPSVQIKDMCLENFTDHVWVGHIQKVWSSFDNRINSFFFFQNCKTSDGINLRHINNGMTTIPIGFKQNCSFCLFATRWRFRLLQVSHPQTGRFDWSVKLTNPLWETSLGKDEIFILFFYDFSKFGIDKGVKFKLICGWINFTFWQFYFFDISKLKISVIQPTQTYLGCLLAKTVYNEAEPFSLNGQFEKESDLAPSLLEGLSILALTFKIKPFPGHFNMKLFCKNF